MDIKDSDLYCYCNLPAPPKWLIEEICQAAEEGYKTNTNMQFEKRPISDSDIAKFKATKNLLVLDGQKCTRAIYRRYNISERAGQWVKDNIGSYSQMGAQLMRDGDAFTPHTDGGPRRYILNYLIHSGGPAVKTQFYHEPGYEVYRDGPAIQIPITGRLTLIAETIAPEGTWMAIFGKVIHAVANIKSSRIQFSISFSAEEFEQLKEKHNLELTYHG